MIAGRCRSFPGVLRGDRDRCGVAGAADLAAAAAELRVASDGGTIAAGGAVEPVPSVAP